MEMEPEVTFVRFRKMKSALFSIPLIALAVSIAGCSSEPDPAPSDTGGGYVNAPATSGAATGRTDSPSDAAEKAPTSADGAANVIRLEGLGALKVGQAVPPGSGWAERGAQISDECRLITSPDYPGVYAIAEGGKVRRITVGERSAVKLVEGIGVGSSEADVRRAFPGFRETPHAYIDSPGKYLTAPGAESGDPAVRFEIGEDGNVDLIHVGTMPVLGYVEGCA